jgi:hypothetical protein
VRQVGHVPELYEDAWSEKQRGRERKVGYLALTSPLIITKLDDSSDIHLSELSHTKHAQI